MGNLNAIWRAAVPGFRLNDYNFTLCVYVEGGSHLAFSHSRALYIRRSHKKITKAYIDAWLNVIDGKLEGYTPPPREKSEVAIEVRGPHDGFVMTLQDVRWNSWFNLNRIPHESWIAKAIEKQDLALWNRRPEYVVTKKRTGHFVRWHNGEE